MRRGEAYTGVIPFSVECLKNAGASCGLICLPAMPAVGGHGILPEKLLCGSTALGLDIVAHNPDGFLVGGMMIAIRPVAGVKNVIFAEDVPQGVEPFPVKVWAAGFFDAGGGYFRKFHEDVLVLRQVAYQRPVLISGCGFSGHARRGQMVNHDPQLGKMV